VWQLIEQVDGCTGAIAGRLATPHGNGATTTATPACDVFRSGQGAHRQTDQDTDSDNDDHADDEREKAQGHGMTLRRAVTRLHASMALLPRPRAKAT
jgi:hypothetical protein